MALSMQTLLSRCLKSVITLTLVLSVATTRPVDRGPVCLASHWSRPTVHRFLDVEMIILMRNN
jgi:hypothetical protein